jgi:ferredoxin-thioredoxin reductase catalytic subunit
VGQLVGIRIYPERTNLTAHDAIVASHVRSFWRNETRYGWQHCTIRCLSEKSQLTG